MKLYSVCYLKERGRTLMQRTRDDCFQRGVWNGPGGKVDPGEGFTQCILREFLDETGLELLDPVMRGMIVATMPDGSEHWVAVYTATRSGGSLSSQGREGPLHWVADSLIPRLRKWSIDTMLFDSLEDGRVFDIHVRYGPDREVLESRVEWYEASR